MRQRILSIILIYLSFSGYVLGGGSIIIPGSETYLLSIEIEGSGIVTTEDLRILCGDDCSEDYPEESDIELTATANPGNEFAGWSGCPLVDGNICRFELGNDTTVTAVFIPLKTVILNIAGRGSFTSTDDSLTCSTSDTLISAQCTFQVSNNSNYVFSATSEPGWRFSEWSGCETVVKNKCSITVTSEVTVTANFSPQLVLNVEMANHEIDQGTDTDKGSIFEFPTTALVRTTDGVYECLTDCSMLYYDDEEITVVAHDANNQVFAYWENCISDIGARASGRSCTITLTQDLYEEESPGGPDFRIKAVYINANITPDIGYMIAISENSPTYGADSVMAGKSGSFRILNNSNFVPILSVVGEETIFTGFYISGFFYDPDELPPDDFKEVNFLLTDFEQGFHYNDTQEFDLEYDGQSCGEDEGFLLSRGYYYIHEIDIDYSVDPPVVNKLALDYTHHCWLQQPRIVGAIRFNSTVPTTIDPLFDYPSNNFMMGSSYPDDATTTHLANTTDRSVYVRATGFAEDGSVLAQAAGSLLPRTRIDLDEATMRYLFGSVAESYRLRYDAPLSLLETMTTTAHINGSVTNLSCHTNGHVFNIFYPEIVLDEEGEEIKKIEQYFRLSNLRSIPIQVTNYIYHQEGEFQGNPNDVRVYYKSFTINMAPFETKKYTIADLVEEFQLESWEGYAHIIADSEPYQVWLSRDVETMVYYENTDGTITNTSCYSLNDAMHVPDSTSIDKAIINTTNIQANPMVMRGTVHAEDGDVLGAADSRLENSLSAHSTKTLTVGRGTHDIETLSSSGAWNGVSRMLASQVFDGATTTFISTLAVFNLLETEEGYISNLSCRANETISYLPYSADENVIIQFTNTATSSREVRASLYDTEGNLIGNDELIAHLNSQESVFVGTASDSGYALNLQQIFNTLPWTGFAQLQLTVPLTDNAVGTTGSTINDDVQMMALKRNPNAMLTNLSCIGSSPEASTGIFVEAEE